MEFVTINARKNSVSEEHKRPPANQISARIAEFWHFFVPKIPK